MSNIPPESVFSYPDLDLLYEKVAIFSNVEAKNILLTAGSDGAIRACFEACVEPGDKVILTRPTFAMYSVYSMIYGAEVIWLDYDASDSGPYLSPEKFINAIKKEKPKMVCLPNPDSPTGTVFVPDDLREIVDVAGEVGALMLIDEAYHPYYPWTAVPWINECEHLVVSRSFSKAWGAAGLRVGYAVANQHLITFIHKQRPMYEVGSVSAHTIYNLLNYENEMVQSVIRLNNGKEYFQDEMKKLGFSTYASYGNFCHIKFGDYSDSIAASLETKVYYRKDFNMLCLEGYSRLSATTKDRFQPIVDCIVDALNIEKLGN